MSYREDRAKACQELFLNFRPDVSRCREPEIVLKVVELAASGLYTAEIAEIVGKTPKAIQKIYRRYNFPDMHNFFPPLLEQRIGWTGGVKLMKGYAYKRTPGHPNGTKHGSYVAVHRLVMEEKLGRYLLTTEVVDHIDGDITNNHPDNLRVFQSNAEHLKATLKGRCPKWSDEGVEAQRAGTRRYHLRRKGLEA